MTSILIVEDDNDINNLICNTLKAEGYQCERAFDGKEGADKIEQNRYDLLLLDIMLPEINGYELLDYVRRIGDTPVIIYLLWDRWMKGYAGFVWARMITYANHFR